MIRGGLLLAEAGRGKRAEGVPTKGRGRGPAAGADFHVPLMVVMSVYLNYVSHTDVHDLRGKDC